MALGLVAYENTNSFCSKLFLRIGFGAVPNLSLRIVPSTERAGQGGRAGRLESAGSVSPL